ncbi:MAG: galactose mutarotase [Oscillospiraceae bacterium]|nr:galactose mutarotase [Oscillospiraceae bacterium]
MTIEKKPFGQTKDGKNVEQYTLSDKGIVVEIITLGAIIRSIKVPVGGKIRDVALGFDTVEGYETNKGYHGAVIGRISNRVANAEYTLNGKHYKLEANDGNNSLHGGFTGLDKQVWTAKEEPDALVLTLTDKEGTAAGYPGDLEVTVKYTLSDGELGLEYFAKCSEDTPINLTNHCYFNLEGHGAGDISGHKIQIFANEITPIDETLIPTGKLMEVAGTAFDLREPTLVAPGLESSDEQIKLGGGYDHNWVLSSLPHRELAPAAVALCSDLSMTCATTKPGVQFYSGNMMQGESGKENSVYSKRTGFCLETQFFPNSVNTPEFPAPILEKGDTYTHKTTYLFKEV